MTSPTSPSSSHTSPHPYELKLTEDESASCAQLVPVIYGACEGQIPGESDSGAKMSWVLDDGFRDLGDGVQGALQASLKPLTQVKPCVDPQEQ